MNKIINIVLSGLLWKRYKFLIVSLVATVLCMVVISQVHADYIAFQQTSGEKSFLGMSFVLKWLAWIVTIIVFFMANHFYNKKKEREDMAKDESNSAFSRILKGRWTKSSSSKNDLSNLNSNQSSNPKNTRSSTRLLQEKAKSDDSDPFANIRNKQKLRSYADVVIDNKDPNSK